MIPASLADQVTDELQRELNMRQMVYPKLIKTGKLSMEIATQRIRLMEIATLIIDHVTRQARSNLPQAVIDIPMTNGEMISGNPVLRPGNKTNNLGSHELPLGTNQGQCEQGRD